MKNRYFFPTRFLAFFYILFFNSVVILAQQATTTEEVVYYEQFSGETFPPGWKTITHTDAKSSAKYEWTIVKGVNSREDNPGGSAMNIKKTASGEAKGLNIWAFTQGITMFKDIVYTISFYNQNNAAGTANLSLVINNVQDYNLATTITTQTITSSSTGSKSKWEPHEYISTFTVAEQGVYYIGFGITYMNGDINSYIDEIKITASSGPMAGIYKVGLDGHFIKPSTAVGHLNIRGIADTVVFEHTDSLYTIESDRKLTLGLAVSKYVGSGLWPVTLRSSTPGAAMITGRADKESLIFLDNVENVHLEGLRIHNSSANNPWAVGTNKSNNCSINGCIISAGSETGNAGARGVSVNASNNILVKNNWIHSVRGTGVSVSGNKDNSLANPYGIVITGGGTNHKIYNNSISMTGDRSVAGSVSAPIALNTGLTGLDIRNNILSNTQTSSAVGATTNYAFYTLGTNGSFANIDYNLYYAASSSTLTNSNLGYMAGANAERLNDWKALTLKDSSSMFGQPAFISNSNLAMDVSHPRSWYANGTGVQLAAVPKDMIGVNRSTDVVTGGVDLGGLEFTPTATAPDMVATGVRLPGYQEVFTFAERTMAVITWSATSTTLPANFAIKYRPGQFVREHPDGYMADKQMNSWMEIIDGQQSEPYTYSYDFEMFYDEALLGEVVEDSNAITIAKKEDPNGDWIKLDYVEYDFTSNKMTKRTVETAAFFTASEPVAQKPLPVVLLSFTASKQAGNTLLTWTTAQENNNAGFEVQASIDGLEYSTLAFVEASDRLQGHTYSFTDNRANKTGAFYYRLRQLNLDGQSETYGPVVVNFGQSKVRIAAYPNPMASQLELSLVALSDSPLLLVLTNAQGKEVLKENIQLKPGTNQEKLLVPAQLPAGLYFLSATWDQQTQLVKLIKE